MTYQEEVKNWENYRSEMYTQLNPDEFAVWLKEHPRPLMSESEHEQKLNTCINAANKTNELRNNVFCPISRMNCIIQCECYSPAVVHGTLYERCEETDAIVVPWITGGYCTAFILKGDT